jgi:thymidylate synthase
MRQYLDQLQFILDNGSRRDDRTGTGTVGVFGMQSRYDLTKGFPAVTTKKLYWKGIIHELLWFLSGDTNIRYLIENGVHIWNDDAYRHYKEIAEKWNITPFDKDAFMAHVRNSKKGGGDEYSLGDLGPVYGAQWRNWSAKKNTVDQLSVLISSIKTNPYSRRHILSSWNVGDIDTMALPPCHVLMQFYVDDGRLSCQMYQRSADFALGVPFNVASYALLTHMIAQVCNLEAHEFIHTTGDGHIYLDHIETVKEQLARDPFPLPRLELNPDVKNIDDFKFEDIKLIGYESHPPIKFQLSTGLARRSNEG